jgi:hypothetical protein
MYMPVKNVVDGFAFPVEERKDVVLEGYDVPDAARVRHLVAVRGQVAAPPDHIGRSHFLAAATKGTCGPGLVPAIFELRRVGDERVVKVERQQPRGAHPKENGRGSPEESALFVYVDDGWR